MNTVYTMHVNYVLANYMHAAITKYVRMQERPGSYVYLFLSGGCS